MNLQTLLSCTPDLVAPALLGYEVVTFIGGVETGGIISETEAYLSSGDPASHGSRPKSRANQSLYLPAGTVYVYQIRQHYLFNIVTETEDKPSAVLIRAIVPSRGIDTMRLRRGERYGSLTVNGPGKVCQALGIDKTLDGSSIFANGMIKLLPPQNAMNSEIMISRRFGIIKNTEAMLRFELHLP